MASIIQALSNGSDPFVVVGFVAAVAVVVAHLILLLLDKILFIYMLYTLIANIIKISQTFAYLLNACCVLKNCNYV